MKRERVFHTSIDGDITLKTNVLSSESICSFYFHRLIFLQLHHELTYSMLLIAMLIVCVV